MKKKYKITLVDNPKLHGFDGTCIADNQEIYLEEIEEVEEEKTLEELFAESYICTTGTNTHKYLHEPSELANIARKRAKKVLHETTKNWDSYYQMEIIAIKKALENM